MPAVANCDGRDVLIAADGTTVLRREGANDIEVATSINRSIRDIDNLVFAGPRPG